MKKHRPYESEGVGTQGINKNYVYPRNVYNIYKSIFLFAYKYLFNIS